MARYLVEVRRRDGTWTPIHMVGGVMCPRSRVVYSTSKEVVRAYGTAIALGLNIKHKRAPNG